WKPIVLASRSTRHCRSGECSLTVQGCRPPHKKVPLVAHLIYFRLGGWHLVTRLADAPRTRRTAADRAGRSPRRQLPVSTSARSRHARQIYLKYIKPAGGSQPPLPLRARRRLTDSSKRSFLSQDSPWTKNAPGDSGTGLLLLSQKVAAD